MTVAVINRGSQALQLPAAVVNAYYGADRRPAGALLEPGSRPFPAQVLPGAEATGVFVFEVPREPATRVEVEADLDTGLRIVVFRGRPADF